MEINIKNENLSVCSCVCRTKNNFSAECDVIIPDSKPDILKALQLSARPRITNCETKNGRVTVTGTICFNILYLADDEEKSVKSITSSCEFSNVVREDAISENMITFVDVDSNDLSCVVANCRKITLKASLSMSLQVYSCCNIDLVKEIDGACIRTEKLTSSIICAHAQSTTTLTDSFPLSVGKAPVVEMLRCDGTVTDSELKVIDDKAIIKGTIRITALYRTENKIEYARTEMPFAHIIPADGIREEMNTEYCIRLLSVDASASENPDGEKCIIDFSAEFLFRVIARATYSAECTTDAFLPHGGLECKYSPISVDSIETVIRKDADIKERITLPDDLPPIAEVYQVNLLPHIETCTSDNDILRASGYAEAQILYLTSDESTPVCSYKTNIDFSVSCPSPGCMLTPVSDCILKNISYTISSDNCIEIRAAIDITVQCIRTYETKAVYSAEQIEHTPENRPSIIVSCVCAGRSLWDIAKEYGVSPENILSANALEDEKGITPHMALIIPK